MSSKPRVRMPVSLRRVCPTASFVGCADVRIAEATHRSDDCRPGTLFAAIPGTRIDGAEFINDAVARGAKAVLVERPVAGVNVPQCVVPSVRRAFSEVCSAIHGNPSARLATVGVTGTNGKTTVTWMVRSILQAAARKCGLIGTVEQDDCQSIDSSNLTTPDAPVLSETLSRVVSNGGKYAALELSSHALHQDRVSGTRLDVAVVTNVTQDHFDYHGTYDAYLRAKARIVELLKDGGRLVVNNDDPGATEIGRAAAEWADVVTYGIESAADLTAEILDHDLAGSTFAIRTRDASVEVRLGLPGRHNVSNALAAAAACLGLGLSLDEIAHGLASLAVVPGRLERVDAGKPFEVFVDYAHTPDALDRVVRSLKSETAGRLICVFGAGGDRDRTKRPGLGRAAATADVAIVTSDNPRSESPEQIVDDVLQGLSGMPCEVHAIVDRTAAIRHALEIAAPGDCVLVAGKGHECIQVVGDQRIPFDDREVVRDLLESRTSTSSTGAVA